MGACGKVLKETDRVDVLAASDNDSARLASFGRGFDVGALYPGLKKAGRCRGRGRELKAPALRRFLKESR